MPLDAPMAVLLSHIPCGCQAKGIQWLAAPAGNADLKSESALRFDARSWTGYEVVTGALSLVLLAFLARSWYDIRFIGRLSRSPAGAFGDLGVRGLHRASRRRGVRGGSNSESD